jgi:hypothetical protein
VTASFNYCVCLRTKSEMINPHKHIKMCLLYYSTKELVRSPASKVHVPANQEKMRKSLIFSFHVSLGFFTSEKR